MRTFCALLILSVIAFSCAAAVEEESVVRERLFESRVENRPKRQAQHVLRGSVGGSVSSEGLFGIFGRKVKGKADGAFIDKTGNTRVGGGVEYEHDGGLLTGNSTKGGYLNVDHKFPGK